MDETDYNSETGFNFGKSLAAFAYYHLAVGLQAY